MSNFKSQPLHTLDLHTFREDSESVELLRFHLEPTFLAEIKASLHEACLRGFAKCTISMTETDFMADCDCEDME
jgi:hypothetical protein